MPSWSRAIAAGSWACGKVPKVLRGRRCSTRAMCTPAVWEPGVQDLQSSQRSAPANRAARHSRVAGLTGIALNTDLSLELCNHESPHVKMPSSWSGASCPASFSGRMLQLKRHKSI